MSPIVREYSRAFGGVALVSKQKAYALRRIFDYAGSTPAAIAI